MTAPLRARTVAGQALPRPGPRSGATSAPAFRSTPRRAPLRLVDDSRLQQAARQRRRRRLVTAAAVFAGLAFLALAGSHAYLVTNQVRIDELQERVEEAQARHQVLRLQVATLEAPDRIVSVATDELGMVEPDAVTFVAPVDAAAASAPPTDVVVRPGAAQGSPPTAAPPSWGTVKPYLGRDT
ncbi:MAG: hypothetical protein KY450_02905 [Actinobacteria bacterium]|nr:hypothetical protein [Actinomycetota bacterium]